MDSKGEYLQSQGFDVKGSVERFCGDETMYYSFLARFTQDPNFSRSVRPCRPKTIRVRWLPSIP